MPQREPPREGDLERSLARVDAAMLSEGPRGLPATAGPRDNAVAFFVAGGALVAVAALATVPWLVIPGALLAGYSAVLAFRRRRQPLLSAPAAPHVGMGASVAGDAILEPGSVIEMGASVGSGATIKAGAKVRWGADVGAGAVVEEGAVIHWGASVGQGAVIGRDAVIQWGASVSPAAVVGPGAVIGAGASVMKGARVEPGARYWPGVTVAGSSSGPPTLAANPAVLERTTRIETVCDRLQAELDTAPALARELLGAQAAAMRSLHGTCRDLLRREQAIRTESSPEQMARLEKESGQIRTRLETEPDAAVKASLHAALEAIDGQKAERAKLSRAADRLEAEQTRLLWTLENVSTQLLRLRTASTASATQPELESSLSQLREEIDAIADALEEVAAPELVSPVVPVSDSTQGSSPPRERENS